MCLKSGAKVGKTKPDKSEIDKALAEAQRRRENITIVNRQSIIVIR